MSGLSRLRLGGSYLFLGFFMVFVPKISCTKSCKTCRNATADLEFGLLLIREVEPMMRSRSCSLQTKRHSPAVMVYNLRWERRLGRLSLFRLGSWVAAITSTSATTISAAVTTFIRVGILAVVAAVTTTVGAGIVLAAAPLIFGRAWRMRRTLLILGKPVEECRHDVGRPV